MEPKKILLDFSVTDFSDAKVCDKSSLIHRSKMEDFKVIADRQLAHAVKEFDSRQNGMCETRYEHNTISIFASRGAGKTTFLLSALNRMSKWYEKDVICLKLIDPSMIENGENTFVDIIARIQESINAVMEDKQSTGCYLKEDERDLKRSVERSYKRLMEGMSFIDGIGKAWKYEDWDDAEYAAMQGMEKAISSINIDEAFQDYVYKALRFIGKKCFVVSFDDIDTDFKKGFQILEVIRKYLTTPMIITILTGDLELYGKLVRKASWDCFDKVFLEKERDFAKRNEMEFSTMIDQLENQYLVKILKPENRIQLSSLKEYLTEPDYQLYVRFDEKDDSQGYLLQNCYTKLLKEIGAYKERSKLDDELRQFLLGMSLRIQIRLLTQIKELELMKSGSHDKHKLATGILSVFWNDINQKADNAKALTTFSPLYTVEMLKFLEFTKSIEVGATFLPETTDDILNKALFAIGTKYNEQVGKFNYLVFDYWIRISLIAQIKDKLWQNGQNGQNETRNLEDLLNYSQLKTDSGLTKSSCLIQAFYNSLGPNMPHISGILEYEEEPYVRADFRFVLSVLPAFGTEDIQKQRISYMSAYKILAVISDIMRVEDTGDEEADLNRMLAQIYKMGQYRSYSVPKLAPFLVGAHLNINQKQEDMGGSQTEEGHFLMDVDEKIRESDIKSFIKKLWRWKAKEIDVSCQSLNRIFIRFYHTLMSLDSNTFEYPMAEKINRMVLALLNSALVEAAMDNGISGIEMNVIGDIEQTFVNNYNHIMPSRSSNRSPFSFFEWLKSCPLLTTFLDPYIASLIEKNVMVFPSHDMSLRHNSMLHIRCKMKNYREQHKKKLEYELESLERAVDDIRNIISYKRRINEKNYYERRQNDSTISQVEYEKNLEHLNAIDNELKDYQKKLYPVMEGSYNVSIESSSDELDKAIHSVMVKRYKVSSSIRRMEHVINRLNDLIDNFGLQDDYKTALQKANEKWEKTSAFVYLMKTYPIYREPDDTSSI